MKDKMTSRTYRVSKIIDAPLSFVYGWCTDFRDDDYKLTGSKWRRKILEKTERRTIYTGSYSENGKERGHVSVVTLKPPNAWHLDTAGDEQEQETGEYVLSGLGANKTKLDMVFRLKYRNGAKAATKKWLVEDSSKFWDKLIVVLLADYAKNK